LESRTKVLAETEAARVETDRIVQETNTLVYESEQFNVRELWHMASGPRQTVLQMREKVHGSDGRRLRPGVHGAHGRFNRLQRTLDGQERLVDYLGRTESEVEEEKIFGDESDVETSEDEEGVVEHAGIKPMWLLRFFTKWARWGSARRWDDGKGRNRAAGVTRGGDPDPSIDIIAENSPSSSSPELSPVDAE
jgi:hypothetical protein